MKLIARDIHDWSIPIFETNPSVSTVSTLSRLCQSYRQKHKTAHGPWLPPGSQSLWVSLKIGYPEIWWLTIIVLIYSDLFGGIPHFQIPLLFFFKTHSLRSARNSGDTGEVCSEIGKLGWWRLCRPSVCALLVFQTHGYKNQQKKDVKTHYFMDSYGGMKRARIPRIHTLRNIHFFLSLLSSCTTLYKLSTSTSNRFIRAATSFSLLATFFWLPKESRPAGLQHASSLSKSHALTCVIRFFWLFYHQAWSHWHFCWFAHCHFRVRSCCAKLWPSVSEYLKMETESHQIVFWVKLVPLGISVVSIKSTLHWSMLILSPHWLRFNDPRDISFYKASSLSKGREASKRWQQQSFRDD